MEDWEKKYFARRQQQIQNQQQGKTNPEIDLDRYIQQRTPRPTFPGRNRVCRLRNDAILYKQLQTEGFGTTKVIIVEAGPAGDLAQRDFENRGMKSCLLVDQLKPIDLSEEAQGNSVSMIEVYVPLAGVFFVQPEHVISSPTAAHSLLRD